MSAANRKRLVRLLGKLGSDQPEERDKAALAAHRLVVANGLSWPDVLNPKAAEHPIPERGTWRQTTRDCLERKSSLRPWEVSFLIDLPKFRRLSTKQRYVLKEIADRVLARGGA